MTMNVNDLIEWLQQNCEGSETVYINTTGGWLYPGGDEFSVEDWIEVEYDMSDTRWEKLGIGGYVAPWKLPAPSYIQASIDGKIISVPPVKKVTHKKYLVINTEVEGVS